MKYRVGQGTYGFETQGSEGNEVAMPDWSFLSRIPWTPILVGASIIFLIVAAWIWIEQRVDPYRGTMDSPDASAFVRGTCGDVMRISLKFSEDRVVEAKYWTDGCRMSSTCGAAAASLALGKTPEELADVDYLAIEQEVGVLPAEDRHCATLAAGTLQEALTNYIVREVGGSSTPSEHQRSFHR
jgi:nitrogen fixation NifU-like protein